MSELLVSVDLNEYQGTCFNMNINDSIHSNQNTYSDLYLIEDITKSFKVQLIYQSSTRLLMGRDDFYGPHSWEKVVRIPRR